MAVARAALIGAIAAMALPYVVRVNHQALGGWANRGVVNFAVSDYNFSWSWPVFCIVTLFAWGCFALTDR